MFGVDFIVDGVFNDCTGTGSGRGVPGVVIGTGATFAFGTGRHADESITLINCVAHGAASGGFFFERLEARGAMRQDGSFRIIGGGAATGCSVGVIDCGGAGVQSIGAVFEEWTNAGWYIGPGGQATVGGING